MSKKKKKKESKYGSREERKKRVGNQAKHRDSFGNDLFTLPSDVEEFSPKKKSNKIGVFIGVYITKDILITTENGIKRQKKNF